MMHEIERRRGTILEQIQSKTAVSHDQAAWLIEFGHVRLNGQIFIGSDRRVVVDGDSVSVSPTYCTSARTWIA